MASNKKRFMQRKPVQKEISLQEAWDVVAADLSKRSRVCYFVDKDYIQNGWRLYDADSNVIVLEGGDINGN